MPRKCYGCGQDTDHLFEWPKSEFLADPKPTDVGCFNCASEQLMKIYDINSKLIKENESLRRMIDGVNRMGKKHGR